MSVNLNDVLWSTCGRSWGFRFLIQPDQECEWLDVYQEAFREGQDDMNFFARKELVVLGSEKEPCIVFRFPDPESRRDEAGRMIPHEFIVFGSSAAGIDSSEQGRAAVWPLVRDRYAAIYSLPKFPDGEQTGVPGPIGEQTSDEEDGEQQGASIKMLAVILAMALASIVGAIVLFQVAAPKKLGQPPMSTKTTTVEDGNTPLPSMK